MLLRREGSVIGVLVLQRFAPGPFTPRQIELVETFADQAVIAIENTRLFGELETRTRELGESLEFQTATSEVLGVISRSPTDVQPVLDALVQSAAQLCEADFAVIRRRDGDDYPVAASVGLSPRSTRSSRATPRRRIAGRSSAGRSSSAARSTLRTCSPTRNSAVRKCARSSMCGQASASP